MTHLKHQADMINNKQQMRNYGEHNHTDLNDILVILKWNKLVLTDL